MRRNKKTLHIILEKKINFLPRSCDKSILKELRTVKTPGMFAVHME